MFPYLFGHDVLSVVITPLEIIFDRIQNVAVHPFSRLEAEEMEKSRSFELVLISESVTRLMKLLQVGFGQAGADIIARNLTSGTFSALQGGRRVEAIYGFCDIRNFTDCCEVLQSDCVVFVNSIAAIIASHLKYSNGFVNKNIGDAFLLVWKYLKGMAEGEQSQQYDELELNNIAISGTIDEAAESSLHGCVGMIEEVGTSTTVQV